MGKIEVTDIVDEGIGKVVVLPSVQQVRQVSNHPEPGGGCSPRFIMDRVVTGIFKYLTEKPE